ncbi:MAG TPA: tRNA (adenosine(37)-N6)-threonylcarbamoyltransferase complex dimerization subunit type 1 TsaB [Steroidobacteraceae bacterium]|jgi:tRNA threonylcarbamoyladenosine biosynthesis protein TsaB|nr:tRNA (adenosine(37)-N6)-threonylcarbamoyltransferase complex dimerization subunit type 1 TsaB [Steroidobacteraceae bacterium]
MKILALDTATENCSAALLIDGRLLAREVEFDRGHAEHILPMIDLLLIEAGLRLAEVDAIAFGRGPGGFTGVRLAASIAQGLAFGAGLPVVPVSDLAALAQRAFDLAFSPERVLVCSDARMQEVYWACFQLAENGLGKVLGAEHVGPPQSVTLPDAWADAPARSVAGIGRGFRAYPTLANLVAPRVAVARDDLLPRAAEVARLAALDVAAGRLLRPEEAIPVYLRDDVARPQARP